MRKFFTKIYGSLYSEELFEYLCDLIDMYDLDTYEINQTITDIPEDIIHAVLYMFWTTSPLVDVDIYLTDYVEIADDGITFDFDFEEYPDGLKEEGSTDEEINKMKEFVEKFRGVVKDINAILNAFE